MRDGRRPAWLIGVPMEFSKRLDLLGDEVFAALNVRRRELEAEGYICSVPGKGSFVCSNDEAEALHRAELLGKFDELVTELGYIGVTKQMLSQRLKGEQNND